MLNFNTLQVIVLQSQLAAWKAHPCAGSGRRSCSGMMGWGLSLPCRSWARVVSLFQAAALNAFWLHQHPASGLAGGALGHCLPCCCSNSGFLCASGLFCNLSLARPGALLGCCRAQSTPGLGVGLVSRQVPACQCS